VRQECDYLAGRLSSIEADKKRADSLERLEFERRRIQKKVFSLPFYLDKYFLMIIGKIIVFANN
jgi:hypothetical protein